MNEGYIKFETTSGLSILMHGVISLPEVTSCDNAWYFKLINCKRFTYLVTKCNDIHNKVTNNMKKSKHLHQKSDFKFVSYDK